MKRIRSEPNTFFAKLQKFKIMADVEHLKKLAIQLYEIGAVKFSPFTPKSGESAPINFDLSAIFNHPHILVSRLAT